MLLAIDDSADVDDRHYRIPEKKHNENHCFWLLQPTQNRLKMAPSPAKMTQDRSKMAPRPAKTIQDRPKIAQDRSKTAQEAPKRPPRCPKKPRRAPKRPPRGRQEAAKRPPKASGAFSHAELESEFKCCQILQSDSGKNRETTCDNRIL